MRKALNENPIIQLAVVGVLLVVAALFLLMRSGGSSAPSQETAQPAATPSAPASTSSPASGSVSRSPAAPVNELEAGPGLPRKVLASYRAGDVVVLLVVRDGGIDDRLVRGATELLRADPAISLFVTDSRHIARYAEITQGVAVDRTPALIVVKPRQETRGDGTPQASVKYGFRGARSVAQAVRDALYKGPERSYDP
jgi:hypothetical protein